MAGRKGADLLGLVDKELWLTGNKVMGLIPGADPLDSDNFP